MIKPITGEVQAQPLNDNFSYLDSRLAQNTQHINENKGKLNEHDENLSQVERKTVELKYTLDKTPKIKNLERTVALNSLTPTIVFIDDDTRNELYDLIFPSIQEYNIPITSALVSGRIGVQSNTITYEQFLEMKDSGLVEFVNHTHDHLNLSELATEDEIDYQIRMCKEWLENEGIKTSHLVYPFGGYDDRVRKVASRYVDSATIYGGAVIDPSTEILDSYLIRRIKFEEELTTIQSLIDETVAKNGSLIINTHSQYETFTVEKFKQIIEYGLSVGVQFKKFEEAFEMFGNVMEVRNPSNGDLISGISSNGRHRVGMPGLEIKHPSSLEDPTIDSPPSFFERMKISSTTFSTSRASEAGFPGPGTLYTSRRHNDGYTYQKYVLYQTNQVLYRYWDGNAWSEFEDVNGVKKYTWNIGPYTISSGSSQNYTVSLNILAIGKAAFVTPQFSLPNGLTYSFAIRGQGDGILRIYNVSSSTIELPQGDWVFGTV